MSNQHTIIIIAPELITVNELWQPQTLGQPEASWVVYRPHYLYIKGLWWIPYIISPVWNTRKIKWQQVDLIHAHWTIPSGVVASLLAWWYRKPLIITEHSGNLDERYAKLFLRTLLHLTMRQAAAVIVPSEAVRRSMHSLGIIVPTHIVYNPVQLEQFQPPAHPASDNVLHLLWVGSFRPNFYENKGGPNLLRAVAQALPDLACPLHLTMIGNGSDRRQAEDLAAALGITHLCTFVSDVPHDEMPTYMQQCDALVLASHRESFGLVLLEAMACGKPVLATRCGGPEEIVTEEVGILVAANDVPALADGIIRMSRDYRQFDPDTILWYAKQRFEAQQFLQRLTTIYEQVVQEKIRL